MIKLTLYLRFNTLPGFFANPFWELIHAKIVNSSRCYKWEATTVQVDPE